MSPAIAIHWFEQDLRLTDNPALTLAAAHEAVMPIYILDTQHPGCDRMGAASRWWLHHSLEALNSDLGGSLSVFQGDPLAILPHLVTRYRVQAVYWNHGYTPWQMRRDAQLRRRLRSANVHCQSTNGSLLWEPDQICKHDGSPYKVFTPFYRKGCLGGPEPQPPQSRVTLSHAIRAQQDAQEISALKLLPTSGWDAQLERSWDVGEHAAQDRLRRFLAQGIAHYKTGRDFPAKLHVSRLSPHLHFGELSVNQLWHDVRAIGDNKDVDHFCSELGWREFSYQLLYHNPDLPRTNLQRKFDRFPWQENAPALRAWQRGQTGIPLVDAGMRELWQTGYLHNRLRMVVGSFLVKNLRLDWRLGYQWFWDTLVDADLGNNSAGWQWIAGCGADAAPYFRIFNPVAQAERFDPQGHYIRKYIPEIAALPNGYLFAPWTAPTHVLHQAQVALNHTYPSPIVDLKASRAEALSAFASLKNDDDTPSALSL